MRPVRFALAALLFSAGTPLCWGQFVRIPVSAFRAPARVPVHGMHLPHGSAGSGDQSGELDDAALALLAGAVALAMLFLVVRDRRRAHPAASRAVVRITAPPPGEAPDWVRAAWVGLEFPLVAGETGAASSAAQQVLTGAAVFTSRGYALDGSAAVRALEAASAEAAAWWRGNAAWAVAPGHQLIFPAAGCERMDALE